MFVYLSPPGKQFSLEWRLLIKEHIANWKAFFVEDFEDLWLFLGGGGSLQTSILGRVEELAGGGTVAVAVGFSDRCKSIPITGFLQMSYANRGTK